LSGIEVREARDEELEAAGELVARAYRALGTPDGKDAEYGEYLDHVRDARGRSRDCPVLVAVDADGTLLGSVSYVPDGANPYADVAATDEAEFRMLGVDPAMQGRGAGRALVEACLARARADGRRRVVLATGPEMRAAHRLYERLGFRRAHDRDFEPVPGILLWAYVLPL
jgi:ribosomal protein S18 acetylase RimI-like enzyme